MCFFFEDISQLEIQPKSLNNQPFYLMVVGFKPTLNSLGKARRERIGIGVSSEEELKPLLDWAQKYGIKTQVDRTDPSTSSE